MDNSNVALITKLVLEAVEKQKSSDDAGYLVPIGVSARHIHLTQEHVEVLFGKGYQLTKKKELMGGQFASNETVTIVGIKLRAIENVRVLGPVRKQTQVEISATDAIKLGVKAPIRESGKIAGKKGNAALDKTKIVYNDQITISGIPLEVQDYVVNKKSALDWVVERCGVSVDKASQIVNDFNNMAEEMGDPQYILHLILRVITVSLETNKIVASLPALRIHPLDQ